MTCGIYKIVCLSNGRIYVGQSQNVESRWITHLSVLRDSKHYNSHLQSAWNKYGESNFKFELIEECSIEQLNIREQFWIDELEAFFEGFNLQPEAGTSRGYVMSEETKKKISEAAKLRNANPEYKKMLSVRAKAQHVSGNLVHKPMGEKARKRLSEQRQGKAPVVWTDEMKNKQSETHKQIAAAVGSEEMTRRVNQRWRN